MPADPEVVAEGNWRSLRCGISSVVAVDAEASRIEIEQPCWHNANLIRPGLFEGSDIHPPGTIENALALLDSPGEWYLDKDEDWLYYMPRADERLGSRGNTQVVAPRLDTLISGEGRIANPVHDVVFKGLTFADATWLEPNSPAGYAVDQAGFRFQPNMETMWTWAHEEHLVRTPGNVRFKFAHRIMFAKNVFTRLGSIALDFDTGSQNNSIVRNKFFDTAHTGIQLGGIDPEDHHPTDPRQVTRDNLISDNLIKNIGVEYPDGPGIFVGYTKRSDILYNELRNLPYTGISVGWGYALTDEGGSTVWNDPSNGGLPTDRPNQGWTVYDTPTTSEGNRVIGNRISNYLKKLIDGGAIYTLGWQGTSSRNGMVIARNYMTQPNGPYFMIYMDVGTRYVKIERNVAFAKGSSNAPIPGTSQDPSATPDDFHQHATGGCAPWGDLLYRGNFWFEPSGPTWFCGGAAPDRQVKNVQLEDNVTISDVDESPMTIRRAAGPR